jgi:methanogenic corrinoid protein MtbC1
MADTRLFARIEESLLRLDRDGVADATRAALEEGAAPEEIISKGLAPGMEQVGERFEKGDFFLPELLLSAKAVQGALEILRPQLIAQGHRSAGSVVLGTVQGDIHHIGKSVVGAVLEGDGYEVYDLGEDVPPDEIVAKAREVDADIVALSALISVAVSKMAETIALCRESGLRARIIVGGAAVTQESADAIGADAYGKDAWVGLRRIRAQREKQRSA